MQICSCAHEITVSIYAIYEPRAINNVSRNTCIHTFHISSICPEQICIPHHTYICPSALLLWYAYRPYITAHTCAENNKVQLLNTISLPYRCHKQICPSNATHANYFMCRHQIATMSVYVPHMNSMNQPYDQKHWNRCIHIIGIWP